jgi:hypothetical protein
LPGDRQLDRLRRAAHREQKPAALDELADLSATSFFKPVMFANRAAWPPPVFFCRDR